MLFDREGGRASFVSGESEQGQPNFVTLRFAEIALQNGDFQAWTQRREKLRVSA